ncbi:hypothetical protein EE393_19095 [Salmonella enterica]|uniref:Uncharacterized protein n=2 Tax=Salmonella enterica TaxID=28901 RepID=A0A7Z0Y066_SALDZ|nr:hypothetical protein [Salmonella enterica]OHF66946.1 hypothetical protein A7T04_13960 [Salmonella enterica subsp. diarizonae serovar 60:r:e,n,x,z15]OSG79830.1 hypothetical protein R545_25170 [Salmonella enterica subsp. diarizonae serovar Rough:r:z]PUO59364.1 hypothetical protein DAX55_25175 [Salmonella enterica subsp. enterica]EAN4464937.1 hypothetical protein [Salmonella enterica]
MFFYSVGYVNYKVVICSLQRKNKVQAEHICGLNAVGIMNYISEHLEPVQVIPECIYASYCAGVFL